MPSSGTLASNVRRLPHLAPALACVLLIACAESASAPPAPARGGGTGATDAGAGTGAGGSAGGTSGNGGPAAPDADARAPGTGGSTTEPPPGGPTPPAEPKPDRLVVLGDSIVACLGVGDKDAAACGPKQLHAYLAAGAAPGLRYENLAISGAVTQDVVARELPQVRPGTGHPLVMVFVGGNDLRPYLIGADAVAEAGFAKVMPQIEAAWKAIFDFFADRQRFPAGATILMNNQYDPFDDCTAPPYFISAKKHMLLGQYNDALARMGREHGATLTDQYTPYLGHGHHYAIATCPHYKAGSVPFMNDLIHPNVAGHANLFLQWKKVVDGFYGP